MWAACLSLPLSLFALARRVTCPGSALFLSHLVFGLV